MASPLAAVRRAAELRRLLHEALPWTQSPLVIGAPMRTIASPALAVAISRAGGLGFIGAGGSPESVNTDLEEVKALLKNQSFPAYKKIAKTEREAKLEPDFLPVGIGLLLWDSDLDMAAAAVARYRPCAVWLYAPRDGQPELDRWTQKLREASPGTQVWIQVGTVREAVEAAASAQAPDVLVMQGNEAGGHGRAHDAIGFITLLPEVADRLGEMEASGQTQRDIALVAAGGIVDGRGAAAAFGLGAAGVVLGTRFLAASEARIAPAYQAEVVRASEGGAATGRTLLYNHLRGTFGWPPAYSPRAVLNQSSVDERAGVTFEELQRRHDEAVGKGGLAAWGPEGRVATYAGAGIGLVRSVQDAAEIVESVRDEAKTIQSLLAGL